MLFFKPIRVKSPCLHLVFGPPFTPKPLFQPQIRDIHKVRRWDCWIWWYDFVFSFISSNVTIYLCTLFCYLPPNNPLAGS